MQGSVIFMKLLTLMMLLHLYILVEPLVIQKVLCLHTRTCCTRSEFSMFLHFGFAVSWAGCTRSLEARVSFLFHVTSKLLYKQSTMFVLTVIVDNYNYNLYLFYNLSLKWCPLIKIFFTNAFILKRK